ncbi:MAG: hypothetical protein Q9163_005645 [Psora crenata]
MPSPIVISPYLKIDASFLTSRLNQLPTISRYIMNSRDAPIANAAAEAGFDCSDWHKLEGLINAVKAAVFPVTYPDRYRGAASFRPTLHPDKYRGAASFRSSLYPDKWRPKDLRERRGGVKSYQDLDRPQSVPAFTKTAIQILKDVRDHTRRRRDSPTPTMLGITTDGAATGSIRLPLRIKSGNQKAAVTLHQNANFIGSPSATKRPAEGYVDLTSSSPKRLKTGGPAELLPRDENNRTAIIDLTITSPARSRPPSHSSLVGQCHYAEKQARPQQGSRKSNAPIPQRVINHDTTLILARCASRLRGAGHGIEIDRDSLRECWELDTELQLQNVTDDLAELNACFSEAEKVIARAIAIVESRLLHRR